MLIKKPSISDLWSMYVMRTLYVQNIKPQVHVAFLTNYDTCVADGSLSILGHKRIFVSIVNFYHPIRIYKLFKVTSELKYRVLEI